MKRIYLLSLVALLVFAACSKDGVNQNDTPALPNKMLVLESEAELHSTITKLSEMSDAELDTYQISKGYKSLAKIAEEVYFSVDPESFTSEQEMQDFLNANKDYITLGKDENGEWRAEPVFHRNIYKRLINQDQMLEINGTAYKVFKEGVVSAPKEHVNELMSLDSKKLKAVQSNGKFTYIPFQIELPTKGTVGENTVVHGRDRVAVSLKTVGTLSGTYLVVRADAHKKTMGVWWVAERRIYYDFYVNARWDNSHEFLHAAGNKMCRSYERTVFEENRAEMDMVGRYNCSATTSQVGHRKARISN